MLNKKRFSITSTFAKTVAKLQDYMLMRRVDKKLAQGRKLSK